MIGLGDLIITYEIKRNYFGIFVYNDLGLEETSFIFLNDLGSEYIYFFNNLGFEEILIIFK